MDDVTELTSDTSTRSMLIAFLESRIAELEKRESESARIVWGLTEQLERYKANARLCPICPCLRVHIS